MKKANGGNKRRLNWLFIISILLLVVASSLGGYVAYELFDKHMTEEVYRELRNRYVGDAPVILSEVVNESNENEIDANLLRQIDFDGLKDVNPDYESWVYIPDTYIDYGVMQERVFGRFRYERINAYGVWDGVGVPFKPALYDGASESAHDVIFGHTMSWQEPYQFTMVANYLDSDWAGNHRYIYVYYPDHSERYEVWTGLNVYSNDLIYEIPTISGSKAYSETIDHIDSLRYYGLIDKPRNTDKLLVLSCCNYNFSYWNGRSVVVAKADLYYDYETNKLIKYSDKNKKLKKGDTNDES